MCIQVHDGCQSPTCPIHAIQQGATSTRGLEAQGCSLEAWGRSLQPGGIGPQPGLHTAAGAYGVAAHELPDHRWWRALCSPHVPPCCWAKDGFLNPGRRQCVGGGGHLHEVELGYLEEWLDTYSDAPRRWASVNTMVAHEHFMLRLPSLDEHLAALLRRMARGALQEGLSPCSPPGSHPPHP